MAGNIVEIIKCLRDGLAATDTKYKDTCLAIILNHITMIVEDFKIDVGTYAAVLHMLHEKYLENDD